MNLTVAPTPPAAPQHWQCPSCGSHYPVGASCGICHTTQPGPAAPAATAPAGYTLRYGVQICNVCGLAKNYCKGHAPADPPSSDGSDSDLARRIAQARGGR